MKKILISDWVPEECLKPYRERYHFVVPTREAKSFTYEQITEEIADCDAYLVLDCCADRALLERAKKLKAVASFGVGYNSIDWEYATEIGLPVLNTPTSATEATAEHTVALLMSTMRGTVKHDREIRRGIWNSANFDDGDSELYGRTLGIMGFGRIGKAVCRKAQGLGMTVVYYDKYRAAPAVESEYGVTYLPFEMVLQVSDAVTLHMPYVPENHHIFNAEAFRQMKASAYLVNAARGALIDEKALVSALYNKTIKGAGLDVFENEPAVAEELLRLDNVVLTPHIASCTLKARMGMCTEALEGISAILEGKLPYQVVNPQVFEKQE